MNTDRESLKELAALHAIGGLDGDEAKDFSILLASHATAREEAAAFALVAEALAVSVPAASEPPRELKARILKQVEQSKARHQLEAQLKQLRPPATHGFSYAREATADGWIPLPVSGAYIKLLSFDDSTGYATVLGKLDPGARYPAHHHLQAEDVFMISGDLHIGENVIRPMDFHHAEAGTDHGVNWSEHGCVLLAVLSKEDLIAQFLAA